MLGSSSPSLNTGEPGAWNQVHRAPIGLELSWLGSAPARSHSMPWFRHPTATVGPAFCGYRASQAHGWHRERWWASCLILGCVGTWSRALGGTWPERGLVPALGGCPSGAQLPTCDLRMWVASTLLALGPCTQMVVWKTHRCNCLPALAHLSFLLGASSRGHPTFLHLLGSRHKCGKAL